ncbi:GPI mannosyltransferase 3 [Anastrepha obliqua]|uniref:GPI mannosyltransferase 3 n=1 Tax=Anastrepha obliqua TaxID=95512 RepID=UPI00240A745E|nr:GPI mannosyltransferase 3 [Anastrepha obliqua]XP_054732049.1 GPI mannosyltransferase 3 [Anastrepha obliqua]
MNLLLVFLIILAVRLASVFIVQTYYVPDEYWQSLEVAHKLTFGYGYLTWEWVQGIRSYLYPLLIAGIYKALALLNLDTAQLLVISPRILQAMLSAYSDYRFFVWSGKKKWALFLILVPWFWFYTGSRTLSNTLETSLTTIALSYFPWSGETTTYLWFAAVCCFLRPTASVIWIPLCIYHLRKSRLSTIDLIFKHFLVIGLLVAGVCVCIDTYWHGSLIFTPYEFFKYNILHNIGSIYGSHPWYWYFTVGLPTVLGINTLPFIFGVMDTVRHKKNYPVRKQLLITILLSLIVLSTVEHKEFRFVASLLPLCLYITADTLTRWSYNASRSVLWFSALVIVFGNALPAWYLSTVHQKGPLDVMTPIQKIARDFRDENEHRASILFLMPCHSTPYYSHVHENITMRFLTCEPNLQNKPNYVDEADQFYQSPVHWLRSHIPSYPRTAMPSHIVLYQPLAPIISEFLVSYKILHRISNAEVNENVAPQMLMNEWSRLLKEKEVDVKSLLQHVRNRVGKNILVYQRLRAGEENTFNRDEYKTSEQTTSQGSKVVEDIPYNNGANTAEDTENHHNMFN